MAERRQTDIPRFAPVLLSVVAGYVDACLYLALFGVFVAQLTGSFVVAGTEIVAPDAMVAIRVGAIPLFVLASICTTVLATWAERTGRHPLVWTLALEAVLLAAMLAAATAGAPLRHPYVPAAIAATSFAIAAMGVQSALVRLLMRGVGSTNVMTTNTTAFGVELTETVIAWIDRRRGLPAADERYAAARGRLGGLWPLIAGFLAGTFGGAIAFMLVGLSCLLAAIATLLALAARAWRREVGRSRERR